jgi:hypothetical protein
MLARRFRRLAVARSVADSRPFGKASTSISTRPPVERQTERAAESIQARRAEIESTDCIRLLATAAVLF